MKKSIQSLIIVFFMAVILLTSFCYLNISPHIALLVCIALLLSIGIYKKIKWDDLEDSMAESIFQALKPIFILALVGILISVWMMSGTVPTILFYGLKYMSPKWFYINCILLCMITSTFNGSAITTVSTIGVSLIGIASGLNLPLNVAAGAIICGSCFGDKCSPLSETTNLAPGILKVDLFTHVKHLIWTTIPAMTLTILIFGYLGLIAPESNLNSINMINSEISKYFNISVLTLIPPIIVIILAYKRVPAMPTFVIGIISSLVITAFVQKDLDIVHWAKVMQDGFVLKNCENELIPKLVNRGGLQSMMWSISLVAIALSLGGLLKRLGIIDDLLSLFVKKLTSKGTITFAASLSCILVNFLSGEQFLSILLPGKAFEDIFRKNKIPLKNLSRTLEDCGTLVNPLVPWGVAGAIFTGALGIRVMEYLPFVFFLFLSPLFTILFGFFNIDEIISNKFRKLKK